MEAFISSFGFDATEFREHLAAAHGLVAGSSVLAEFLRAAGQEPGFEPDDMDIWLYMPDNDELLMKAKEHPEVQTMAKELQEKLNAENHKRLIEESKVYLAHLECGDLAIARSKLQAITTMSGWNTIAGSFGILRQVAYAYITQKYFNVVEFVTAHSVSCKDKTGDTQPKEAQYAYMNMCDNGFKIDSVKEYKTANGKTVQIISVCSDTDMTLKEYIKNNFDLSCCMASWDPRTNTISHEYPELTLKRHMVSLNCKANTKRAQRIIKYKGRGFKHVESTFLPPEFSADSKWHSLTCIDIVTFDEPTVADYLSSDQDRVVIKSGEQYYGFERKYIAKYLADHYVFATSVKMHRLPMGQLLYGSGIKLLQTVGNHIFSADKDKTIGYNLNVLSA